MNIAVQPATAYSPEANATFEELDRRVNEVFRQVQEWRGWKMVSNPETRPEQLLALVREIFKSVCWYQAHTTEAGFHMFGRLPKNEIRLMQVLSAHKAEEAEHGLWAHEDHDKLSHVSGRRAPSDEGSASPATFAVAAVWWRMAQIEDPLGYLGAEYLFDGAPIALAQAEAERIRNFRMSELEAAE